MQIDEFAALESHALGGLGAAWGAVSFPFLPIELERAFIADRADCTEFSLDAYRNSRSLSRFRDSAARLFSPLEHAVTVLAQRRERRQRLGLLRRQTLYRRQILLACLGQLEASEQAFERVIPYCTDRGDKLHLASAIGERISPPSLTR